MGHRAMTICDGIHMIGGSGLSHPNDCAVYLIESGDLILIDSGAGESFDELVANIKSLELDPKKLKTILVTHKHIDHIGSLKHLKDGFDVQIIAHELDANAIETGIGTGADMYGVPYSPCTVDTKLSGDENRLQFGEIEINIAHIPGHTDGSIAAYIDTPDGRVLFGQDIHGPYLPQWGADIKKARQSLQKMIDLRADILCEGHFGIYEGTSAVEKYIKGYLDRL